MPFPWELPVVPASITDAEGWIDPTSMGPFVRRALELSVGVNSVQRAGEGSFAVKTWFDRDSQNHKITISAGEWATDFAPTPPTCLACLAAEPDPPDPADHAERALRVRFTTVRKSGVKKPGNLHFRITVHVRSAPGANPDLVMPRRHVECLVADFLAELQRG